MAEGIAFNETGTITLTIDNQPYGLRRPKLGQFRYFRDQIRELSVAAVAELQELKDRMDQAEGAEADQLEIEFRSASANTFTMTSVPWLTKVFEQLGDPLPDDYEEWPSWLADPTIPSKIIDHWRTVPLAPGAKGTN